LQQDGPDFESHDLSERVFSARFMDVDGLLDGGIGIAAVSSVDVFVWIQVAYLVNTGGYT
jgi:hypothetical protein